MRARIRALAITPLLLVGAVLLPSAASARPGPQPEAVLVVPGYGSDCIKNKWSSANWPLLKGKVQEGIEAAQSKAAAAGHLVDPVPADWYLGWAFSPCDRTIGYLAKRLDTALAELQAKTSADKVDIVSFSFGGAIVRFCGTNAGGNTPRCARRIDDWIGLVNATNGSKRANLAVCGVMGDYHLWQSCSAFMPGSLEIRAMNALGPTPKGTETSIYWTPGDEYISPPPSSRLPGARNHRTTSPVGRVHHVQIWDPAFCPAMPEIIGREVLDLDPWAPGDDDVDCSAAPAG